MTGDDPSKGSEYPSPPPPRISFRSKIIIVVVIIVVIFAGIVVIALDPNAFSPYQNYPQPSFAFLPATDITSIYGIQIVGSNYSSNLSFTLPSKFTSQGLVQAEAWLYQPFQTNQSANASSIFIITTLIMEMNSSSQASVSFSALENSLYTGGTEVSKGSFSGFQYALWEGNSSSTHLDVYFAHEGKYILVMQFFGSSISHKTAVFDEQVIIMFPTGGD
ncbi:MAG: hypothetical protein QXU18_15205 [Thermoplasmatales archaeon]